MKKLLVSLLFMTGCATVYVPKTPQSEACMKQCFAVYQQCREANRKEGRGLLDSRPCGPYLDRCFDSCPDLAIVQCPSPLDGIK